MPYAAHMYTDYSNAQYVKSDDLCMYKSSVYTVESNRPTDGKCWEISNIVFNKTKSSKNMR